MSSFISILSALFLLSLLVTVHEFGHFYAGKKLGFKILDFSVGMGPVLLKRKKNNIDYCLRAFPIGGMCRFAEEDEAASSTDSFNAKPAWKRFIVVFAGPLMNFATALFFCIIAYAAYGSYMPVIHEVTPSMPAYSAGLEPGDILLRIDDKKIHDFYDATDLILKADGEKMDIEVLRGGDIVNLCIHDFFDDATGSNLIGVTIGAIQYKLSPQEVIGESTRYIGSLVQQTFAFFGTVFKGTASMNDVSGPVGTVAIISEAVRYGFQTILMLTVIINVSLGLMNLLPFPALDGGRLVFILFEIVTGKKVPPEKEGIVHFIGMILLLAFVVYVTFHDISGLLG